MVFIKHNFLPQEPNDPGSLLAFLEQLYDLLFQISCFTADPEKANFIFLLLHGKPPGELTFEHGHHLGLASLDPRCNHLHDFPLEVGHLNFSYDFFGYQSLALNCCEIQSSLLHLLLHFFHVVVLLSFFFVVIILILMIDHL